MPTLIRKVNTLLSYCLLFMSTPTTTSILRDYRQAMAQWQASARVTASAAVMGSVRSHTAAHGVEWNVKDSVSTDQELQDAYDPDDFTGLHMPAGVLDVEETKIPMVDETATRDVER